jgi:hypothetical protein
MVRWEWCNKYILPDKCNHYKELECFDQWPGWAWTRSHNDAVVAGKRKESVVRDPGGLAVALKRERKTVGRRKLRNWKNGLAAGAESERSIDTGTENAPLPREWCTYECLCVFPFKALNDAVCLHEGVGISGQANALFIKQKFTNVTVIHCRIIKTPFIKSVECIHHHNDKI